VGESVRVCRSPPICVPSESLDPRRAPKTLSIATVRHHPGIPANGDGWQFESTALGSLRSTHACQRPWKTTRLSTLLAPCAAGLPGSTAKAPDVRVHPVPATDISAEMNVKMASTKHAASALSREHIASDGRGCREPSTTGRRRQQLVRLCAETLLAQIALSISRLLWNMVLGVVWSATLGREQLIAGLHHESGLVGADVRRCDLAEVVRGMVRVRAHRSSSRMQHPRKPRRSSAALSAAFLLLTIALVVMASTWPRYSDASHVTLTSSRGSSQLVDVACQGAPCVLVHVCGDGAPACAWCLCPAL
jgi:hypothetical protein